MRGESLPPKSFLEYLIQTQQLKEIVPFDILHGILTEKNQQIGQFLITLSEAYSELKTSHFHLVNITNQLSECGDRLNSNPYLLSTVMTEITLRNRVKVNLSEKEIKNILNQYIESAEETIKKIDAAKKSKEENPTKNSPLLKSRTCSSIFSKKQWIQQHGVGRISDNGDPGDLKPDSKPLIELKR